MAVVVNQRSAQPAETDQIRIGANTLLDKIFWMLKTGYLLHGFDEIC